MGHRTSESVEGGVDRVHTELEESLTEHEADAGQDHAHHQCRCHHSQDEWQGELTLRGAASRIWREDAGCLNLA